MDGLRNEIEKQVAEEERTGRMTKEAFLTVRWNNILLLGLGLILLSYVAVVLSTSVLSDKAAFIGLVVFGVLY